MCRKPDNTRGMTRVQTIAPAKQCFKKNSLSETKSSNLTHNIPMQALNMPGSTLIKPYLGATT